MKKTISLKATVMMLAAAAIWGFAFVAQRVAADTVGTFSHNGVKFILGALSTLPVALIFERKEFSLAKFKRTAIAGAITGTVLCAASGLQQYSIVVTGNASKAAFITSLYSVFVPLFLLFAGRKTSKNMWLGVACAVLGLYLISFKGIDGFSVGDIITLIGSVFWAFHVLTVDKFVGHVNAILYSSIQFFVCGAESLIIAFIFEDFSLAPIFAAAIPILYSGIMSAGVAFTLQVLSQREAEPTYAAIIFATEPIFAAIGEALILKTYLSPISYIGCAVIFAGVIISQFGPKGQQQRI